MNGFEDLDLTQESIDDELENLDKMDIDDDSLSGVKDEEECAEEALASAYLLDLASEEDIHELAESTEDMQEVSEMMNVAMEKTIVRFDRKARFKHLNKQAELNIARQNNDPLFKKLMKLWMMERTLEKKIHNKYKNKANKIARIKIKDYAANGKRLVKPHPSTVSFKDKPSSRIAKKAVANSKRMFSNGNMKSARSKY